MYDNYKMKNQYFNWIAKKGLFENDYTKEVIMIDPEQGLNEGANVVAKKMDYDLESFTK